MTSVTSSYSHPDYQVDKMRNVFSATDAMMLAEVVMAVIESQSQELMSCLRESLVQAMLGDMDGFLNILTGIELTPSVRWQATSVLDRQAGFVEPRLEDRPSVVTGTAGWVQEITEISFETRLYRPLRKSHLQTRSQAAAYARQLGLHEGGSWVCAEIHKVLVPRTRFF